MNAPSSSPGTPPDYISIPEHLKSEPVVGSRLPARLRHLLQYAGIQSLGDLHGKRLSDFREFRGCRKGTLWSLKSMILLALHPGVNPDPRAWPFPLRRYTPRLKIEVSAAIGHLRFKDLPVSTRLELVLKFIGIEKLGQLHRLPIRELLGTRNLGPETLAELGALLRRAEAGDFTFSERELASKTSADLMQLLDDLVSRLPERHRAILALYLGATEEGPQTLRHIGLQHGITGSCVGQQLARAVHWVRRQGNPRLPALLDSVEDVCVRSHAPLSPVLVSTWQDSARPFRYSPQFYVGIISKLRSDAGMSSGKRRPPTQSRANGV